MESKEIRILHRVKDVLQIEQRIKTYTPMVLYGTLYIATILTGAGSIGFSSNVTSLDRELSTPPVSLDTISRLNSAVSRDILINYRKRLLDQRNLSEAAAAALMLICFGGCLNITAIDFGKK